MSDPTENKPLRRIVLILDFLEGLVKKNPAQETFELKYEDFAEKHKLLDDYRSLKIAFKKIGDETDGAISLEMYERQSLLTQKSVTPFIDTWRLPIVAHVEDMRTLERYRDRIEKEITSKNKDVLFTLTNQDEKWAVLSEKSNRSKKYRMKRNMGRYKLLQLLANKKGYVTTRAIAKNIGVSQERVWDTVEEIRGVIVLKLKVSRESVIENVGDNSGYRMLNIEIDDLKK